MGEDPIFEANNMAVYGDDMDDKLFHLIDNAGNVVNSGKKEQMIGLCKR